MSRPRPSSWRPSIFSGNTAKLATERFDRLSRLCRERLCLEPVALTCESDTCTLHTPAGAVQVRISCPRTRPFAGFTPRRTSRGRPAQGDKSEFCGTAFSGIPGAGTAAGPCWLTMEEIAAGRRYRAAAQQGERYDDGIGYSVRALRDTLAEGIKRGWWVWQATEDGGRVYALHLKGMQVAEDGRFLGLTGDATDERAPLDAPQMPPAPSSAPGPEPPRTADPARLAHLEAEVRALSQMVGALTVALTGAGIAPAADQSTAGVEESKAATAESTAHLIQTPQTPAADTRAARPAAGGGVDALPDDLRQTLQAPDYRGRRLTVAASRLVSENARHLSRRPGTRAQATLAAVH